MVTRITKSLSMLPHSLRFSNNLRILGHDGESNHVVEVVVVSVKVLCLRGLEVDALLRFY